MKATKYCVQKKFTRFANFNLAFSFVLWYNISNQEDALVEK